MAYKESEVRDFIATNFSSLTSYIVNYNQFDNDLTTEYNKIISCDITSTPNKILISDLIKLSVIDKLKQALPILPNLELIDKEFVLLKTDSGKGKQPSVDLFALDIENYCLALLELKKSDSAEREAVTELSAYNQGLQNKYRGLSSLEVLWIPISTEWRITTKSAIEFEMLWQNTLIMPLKMKVDYDNKQSIVNNLEFECFNPVTDLTEIECLNLFSYECFEAFDYYIMEDIPNKEAFINYVTAICSRQKINGFVIFHKPTNMQYPYGFTLCIHNPYKGYLHKKISSDFMTQYSEAEYYSTIKENRIIDTDEIDIDFKTDEIKYFEPTENDMEGTSLKWDAFWEKDFLSVGDFANNPENSNITFLFDRIKNAIDSNNENQRALGFPDFKILFTRLKIKNVDSIMYLGIHLELISKRIIIEHKRKFHQDDFFKTSASFDYLKKVFEEYN